MRLSMLNTPAYRLPNAGDEDCRLVDAVPGSFFMLNTGLLTPGEIKDVFDKRIFLYYEEKVLGQKFRTMGLKTVLATDQSYVHALSLIHISLFRIFICRPVSLCFHVLEGMAGDIIHLQFR